MQLNVVIVRKILSMLSEAWSKRRIASSLNISKGVVSKLSNRIKKSSLNLQELLNLEDKELLEKLYPKQIKATSSDQVDWGNVDESQKKSTSFSSSVRQFSWGAKHSAHVLLSFFQAAQQLEKEE